jgi:hypothetical protein
MLFQRSSSVASQSARARVLLLASVAALVVTSFDVQAAPVARSSDAASQVAAAGSDEFGARKRSRVRRGNNAAGLAMMGMMVGTIGAVIASQQRRDYYEDRRRAYYYGHPQPYVYHQPYAYHRPYAYESKVYHRPRVYHQPHVYPGAPRIGW